MSVSAAAAASGCSFPSISEAISAFRKSPHVLHTADYTGVLYDEDGSTFHTILRVTDVNSVREEGATHVIARLFLTPDASMHKSRYEPNDEAKPPTIVYDLSGRIQSVICQLASTSITRVSPARLVGYEDVLNIRTGRVHLAPMAAAQLITVSFVSVQGAVLRKLEGTLQLPAVSIVQIDRLPVGCPILLQPVDDLFMVCTYLNKLDLFSVYRTCKSLAAVVSNPNIFRMQSRIVRDPRMGVKSVGPMLSYDDALLLNAALHSPILANVRHLQLAPSVLQTSRFCLGMLELLGASTQTSLLSLRIRSHSHDWFDDAGGSDSPPRELTADKYPLRILKSSPRTIHEQFVSGKLRPTLTVPTHPHPFSSLHLESHPRAACLYCLTVGNKVHACTICPSHVICINCLDSAGAFALPQAYFQKISSCRSLLKDFFASKSVAFLKYLLLDVPSHADVLTAYLPSNLETLHFNCSSMTQPKRGDLSWSSHLSHLIEHITQASNLKHLVFGNQQSDSKSISSTEFLEFQLLDSEEHRSADMQIHDLEFLSKLSSVPHLETFRLPFLMNACNLDAHLQSGQPLPIIRMVNKVYLRYEEQRNYFAVPGCLSSLAFLGCFPDLNSLFIQQYVVENELLQLPASIAMKLTELSIGTANSISQAWLDQLASTKFPNLTSLCLCRKAPEGSQLEPYSFKTLFASMPNLIQLNLRNFARQRDIFDDFRQLKHLRHLNDFYWDNTGNQSATNTLKDVFPSLVSLHVSSCSDKSKRTAQWLEPLLRTIPNLQSIKWLNEKRISPAEISSHYAEQDAARARTMAALAAKAEEEKAAMAMRAVQNTQSALQRYGDTDQLSESNRNWYKGNSKAKSEDPEVVARRLHQQYAEEQKRMADAIAASKAPPPFSFTASPSSAAFSTDTAASSLASPSLFNVGGASGSAASSFSKSSGARDKKKTPKRVSIAAGGAAADSPSADGNQSFPPPAFSSPFTAAAFNAAPASGTASFGVDSSGSSQPANPFASSATPFQFSAAPAFSSPSFTAPAFSSAAAPVFGSSSSNTGSTTQSTSFPSFTAVNQALDQAAQAKK